MTFEDQLDELDAAYLAAEGENRDECLQALVALHKDLLRNDKENLPAFEFAARSVCGGIYIPYLFWMALHAYQAGKDERGTLQALIGAFAQGNFDEHDQLLLKPLLVVYFSQEKEFELDRIRTQLIAPAHPAVQEYLNKLLAFPQVNKVATSTFREKFALLGRYFPNFDLFNQTTGDIEKRLSR